MVPAREAFVTALWLLAIPLQQVQPPDTSPDFWTYVLRAAAIAQVIGVLIVIAAAIVAVAKGQEIVEWLGAQGRALIAQPGGTDPAALSRRELAAVTLGGATEMNIRNAILDDLAATRSVLRAADWQNANKVTVDAHAFLQRADRNTIAMIADGIARDYSTHRIESVFVLSYPRATAKTSWRKLSKDLQSRLRLPGAPVVSIEALTPRIVDCSVRPKSVSQLKGKPCLLVEVLQLPDAYVDQAAKFVVEEAGGDLKGIVALFGTGRPLTASVTPNDGTPKSLPTTKLLDLDVAAAEVPPNGGGA